eukprot:COSAG06_NODE_11035_length_1578_cov_1.734956_2_plen_86_part_00
MLARGQQPSDPAFGANVVDLECELTNTQMNTIQSLLGGRNASCTYANLTLDSILRPCLIASDWPKGATTNLAERTRGNACCRAYE